MKEETIIIKVIEKNEVTVKSLKKEHIINSIKGIKEGFPFNNYKCQYMNEQKIKNKNVQK